MKGYERGLKRGRPQVAPVLRQRIPIDQAMTFTGATGVVVGQTAVIGDFPEGNILLLGAIGYLKLTGPTSADLADDFQGDFAVGTAPNADADLADAGEANILPSTALGPASSEVTALARASLATPIMLDNTDGSLEINLNVLLDADEVTDQVAVALQAEGFVEIIYSVMGDD